MFPISGEQLENLIPQKHPFVLISSLKEVNEKTCVTTFKINSDHVLCANGRLSLAGLLENMAQSSGCKLGYEDFMEGKKARVGFIGEVRDFQFTRLPAAGEELVTEITIENKVFGSVTVISGKVNTGGEEIASCKMKVFFQEEQA
ncbi:MAG TPA: hypothetical protein VK154_02575 [Chitinophagales bacterium]|nr:hypothetical protein [Chitinophagales bacterium]